MVVLLGVSERGEVLGIVVLLFGGGTLFFQDAWDVSNNQPQLGAVFCALHLRLAVCLLLVYLVVQNY